MTLLATEIFQTEDNHGLIRVLDDGNKRYLTFGMTGQQSCQLKSAPHQVEYEYIRAMLLPLLYQPRPSRVLLLGLGGGSLATCLHHLIADLQITVVELRSAVINVAYSHFQLPTSTRLHVVHSDAVDYLQQVSKNVHKRALFQMIFSDIYDASGIDDRQLQEHYITQCEQLLAHDGWLVLNCWTEHRSNDALLTLLKGRFGYVAMCTTQSGNWVVMACQAQLEINNVELHHRAKTLAAELGFSLLTVLRKLRRAA